ncbi:Pentatricopeptide repeat-containing protein [Nymphaea thermarum]|nr:Pentatricopeptide repeat-containing protein [Nymphaea thermarum]
MLASLLLSTFAPISVKQQQSPFCLLFHNSSSSKWEATKNVLGRRQLFSRRVAVPETPYSEEPNTNLVCRPKRVVHCSFKQCSDSYDADYDANVDVDFVASLLSSCSTYRECRRIHSFVEKGFGKSVLFIWNNLISLYVNFGKLWEAQKVFDGMSARNVVSWTALIGGYTKIGRLQDAFRLFNEMLVNGIRPNGATFVYVLNACARCSAFELGSQVHACVVKGNWSNVIVESALVYFYAQSGNLAGAVSVYDRMSKRDVVCWTTMIVAYAQSGDGDKAMEMFNDILSSGLRPNEFTVCSILKVCGDMKALNCGRKLHAAVVKGMFKNDVYVGSSLVSMYVKCGRVPDARVIFDGMPKRNTVTWTSMIAGYAQNGLGIEAISLFRSMKSRRIIANSLTIVSLLSACGAVGLLHQGKEVHAQILKNSMHSNIYVCSTLIWFYSRCGEYVYGSRVLELMPSRDVISWTALISGCSRLGYGSEALKYMNDMLWEGVEPNQFTYSTALKACTKIEALRQGKWIHASANKTGSLLNVFVGSALIDMYAKCGCVNDAYQVFDKLPKRNVVSWNALILGYARNGLCKEALKLMYRMEAEGMKVDEFVISDVLNACGEAQWENECSKLQCLS